jgi:hypothetical protein
VETFSFRQVPRTVMEDQVVLVDEEVSKLFFRFLCRNVSNLSNRSLLSIKWSIRGRLKFLTR